MPKQISLPLGDKPALTTGPAARHLGIGHSTLNKWRNEGRSPAFIKLSDRKFLWRVSDLDAFLEARRVAAKG